MTAGQVGRVGRIHDRLQPRSPRPLRVPGPARAPVPGGRPRGAQSLLPARHFATEGRREVEAHQVGHRPGRLRDVGGGGQARAHLGQPDAHGAGDQGLRPVFVQEHVPAFRGEGGARGLVRELVVDVPAHRERRVHLLGLRAVADLGQQLGRLPGPGLVAHVAGLQEAGVARVERAAPPRLGHLDRAVRDAQAQQRARGPLLARRDPLNGPSRPGPNRVTTRSFSPCRDSCRSRPAQESARSRAWGAT